MNRPSRTEDDLEHPTWNQSPPFLAPDLTTRQDLNGISNAREQRGFCSAAGSYVFDEKQRLEMNRFQNADAKGRVGIPPAMGGTNVPFIASPTLPGGEGQARSTRPAQLLGWVGWVASVVVMSVVVSFVRDGLPSLSHPADRPTASPAPASVAVESTPLRRLARRQTACGAGSAPADYNMPLHVGAVFIVLGVSGLACAFPLLASKFPFLRIHPGFLFAIRHFGTGVLLATAFVHLLPTAFISLGDPCLSSFWTTDYPPMPGAIALVGIFLVTVIEMIFSPARYFTPKAGRVAENGDAEMRVKVEGRPVRLSVAGHCGHPDVAAAVTRPAQPQPPTRVSIEVASARNSGDADPRSSSESVAEVSHMHVLTPEQQHKKSILQCMMLEVGILFHSVFIGMALSVAVGGDFVVLLIAIAFHQTFEGMALGARIASISWPEGSLQPWLMALAYGCTTPLGQAIGLATHQLYSPSSEFGLVLVGTMNAISAGLLVFASLIELLAEDFLSDHSWVVMRGRKRVWACLLVLLGSILMSLVGAWA